MVLVMLDPFSGERRDGGELDPESLGYDRAIRIGTDTPLWAALKGGDDEARILLSGLSSGLLLACAPHGG
jgi:hypothetical protein